MTPFDFNIRCDIPSITTCSSNGRDIVVGTRDRRCRLRPSPEVTSTATPSPSLLPVHLHMDPSSSSPRPHWADEVEDMDAPRSAGRSIDLPPLAAVAHASFVLRVSSLDPEAAPFFASPGASKRLHFSDSEESFGDSDTGCRSPRPTAASRTKLRGRRRRPRRRHARRGAPQLASPPLQPSAPVRLVTHRPRLAAEANADGFRQVHSHRRWRRSTPPRRPVPADLVGKCFNCLSDSHVKADCTFPSRCFHCFEEGHQERLYPRLGRRTCKRSRSPGCGADSRGSRRFRPATRRPPRRSSSADTISARSASTGREPSVPPVCAPPTLVHAADGPSSEPPRGGYIDLGCGRQTWPAPTLPVATEGGADGAGPLRGFPRDLLRRVTEVPPASPRSRACTLLLQLVVVPRTARLQAAKDMLLSSALLALVLGTRPAVTPAAVTLHLAEFYGISEDRVSVCRTTPDDFIVRFRQVADLELVFNNQRPAGAPLILRWRRWNRLIMGSSGAFHYRALVGMKGVPSHARCAEVAQCILGNAGTKI